MLSEAVAVGGVYCADFVEVYPTFTAFHLNLSERQDSWCHSWDLEDLSLFSRYVGDFGPFTSFTLSYRLGLIFFPSRIRVPTILVGVKHHLNVKDGRDAKAERGARHQICDDALVGLALVNLPELFLSVEFYANSILKNVLNVLLLSDRCPVCILSLDKFLEVGWMTPSDLNRSRRLGNVCKNS